MRKPPAHDPEIIQPTASFGPQPAPKPFTVQVTADNLHVSVSNLTALGQLAERHPDIAMAIVESSNASARYEAKRYNTAAIVTGLVCLAIIGCSASVIIEKGFWAGIAFFMALVVVLAVVTVVYTGKIQDISWVAGMIRGDGTPTKDD